MFFCLLFSGSMISLFRFDALLALNLLEVPVDVGDAGFKWGHDLNHPLFHPPFFDRRVSTV